ncbi:MAG: DNA-binding transcriptional ArsR family regulator [Halobacteriales archaeon]|jgi:DNA-binding transcriptional ArsR family regulator
MTTPSFTVDITEDRLFKLLGNPTRMATLRALWEEFDFEEYVIQERTPIPYSVLRDRAGEPSNFNYHLDRLVGVLVEDHDEGYLLSPLGYNLMRAIDAHASLEYEAIERTELADPCPFCGGTLAASYQREMLRVECLDCGGLADGGNFLTAQIPMTTTGTLEFPRLLDVASHTVAQRVGTSFQGFCWECQAPVERTLSVCQDHDRNENENCPECLGRFAVKLEVACPNCGTGGAGSLVEYALVTPGVQALFADHGRGRRQIGPWAYRLAALGAVQQRDVTADPTGAAYRFEFGGDWVAARFEDREKLDVTISRGN